MTPLVCMTARFHEALRKAGVANEPRLFAKGGHGYGLGAPGTEVATWPERFFIASSSVRQEKKVRGGNGSFSVVSWG